MNYVSLPPPRTVQLYTILNNEIDVKDRIGKHLSSEFTFIKFLRRVDAIAPLLFNAVLEKLQWKI
jgi:hypothetical protein